jgi:hypothetical protein
MRDKISHILIFCVLLTSCGVLTSNTQDSATFIEFKTLINSFETETPIHDFETTILGSESEVNAFLSQFPSDNTTKERLLKVNFADSLVVGVFVGSRPNTSYSVNIDSVIVSPKSSLVYITEIGSADGGRAIVWPAHFVVVEKDAFNHRKIGFPLKRVCELEPCEFPYYIELLNSDF